MNNAKLKSLISKKANGDNNKSLQLYQMYFFERILERLSVSKYKTNIILKGGLLLSSIIGDDERTTKDMDATLKSIPLEKESVHQIINEIISIDLNDNVKFEIVDIKDIRLEDEYGGFKINILSMLDNTKVYLTIEFTTGDRITPREMKYNYNCIFEDKKIPIMAYTLETVIAEKYQTIISRGLLNTRMKDFYDLYVLYNEKSNIIDEKTLLLAIRNTFEYRNTKIDIEDINEIISELRKDNHLKQLWSNYNESSTFSRGIKYDDLFEPIQYITTLISKEFITA